MSTSKFQQGQHKLQIQLTSEVNFFQWKKAIKDQLRTQGIRKIDSPVQNEVQFHFQIVPLF